MRENNSTWTLPHSFYDLYSIFFFFFFFFIERKKAKVTLLSRVRLIATPWTVEPMRLHGIFFFFFCILLPVRQEYWNGLPFPSAGDFPDPGFETGSPALQADTWPYEPQGKTWWASTHQELIKREMLPYKVMTWT